VVHDGGRLEANRHPPCPEGRRLQLDGIDVEQFDAVVRVGRIGDLVDRDCRLVDGPGRVHNALATEKS